MRQMELGATRGEPVPSHQNCKQRFLGVQLVNAYQRGRYVLRLDSQWRYEGGDGLIDVGIVIYTAQGKLIALRCGTGDEIDRVSHARLFG